MTDIGTGTEMDTDTDTDADIDGPDQHGQWARPLPLPGYAAIAPVRRIHVSYEEEDTCAI